MSKTPKAQQADKPLATEGAEESLKAIALYLDLLARTSVRIEQHLAAIASHYPPKQEIAPPEAYFPAALGEAKRKV